MLFCQLKGHFKFLPIGGTVFSLLKKKYNEIMLLPKCQYSLVCMIIQKWQLRRHNIYVGSSE